MSPVTNPDPTERALPQARLDLETLLYVRESMEGILHVGGTINPVALIDSILNVRAEVLGLDADLNAALEDAGSGISMDERWRRIEARAATLDAERAARAPEGGEDVDRLARAIHLARRAPDRDEPYCDNPLTDADLADHKVWAEAVLWAYRQLPPYGGSK